MDGPLNLTSDHANVHFSQSQVTVRPGGSAQIIATFIPPAISSSTLPVYSGFIEIASDSEAQRVSYLGAVGSLKHEVVLDTTDELFGFKLPAILNSSGDPQQHVTTYTLDSDDQPSVLYRCVYIVPCVLRSELTEDVLKPSVRVVASSH